MPVFALAPAAATAFWGATAAGAAATAGIVGGKLQANASRDAANAQVQAAREAQAAQTKANEDALAFQKQQAAEDLARANALQQGNYNQWASREGRLSDFGSMLGLSPRNIPAYVPLTANGQAPSGSSNAASSALPPTPKDLATAVSQANQIAYGGANKITLDGATDWNKIWAVDPDYAFKRMLGLGAGGADAPIAGPFAGAAAASSSAKPYANSFATMPTTNAPINPLVLTPALNQNSFAQFVR